VLSVMRDSERKIEKESSFKMLPPRSNPSTCLIFQARALTHHVVRPATPE
jgi:hypothetical protein